MPIEPSGIHHITVRVRDMDKTASFFRETFGFNFDDTMSDRRRFRVGETLVILREALPGTPSGDRFSEFRIGLDHISLGVETMEVLGQCVDKLRAAGVDTQGIQEIPELGASLVAFRDPDNIQWEFFAW